jgi:2'-5' RNA ligase
MGLPVKETHIQMRYGLIVRLPREVETRIEDTYLSLLGATKSNMGYHITLLGPFYRLNDEQAHFDAVVSSVCQRWQPFHVQVAGLGTFLAKDDNVAYVSVVEPDRIVTLHTELLEATTGFVAPQDERFFKWSVESYNPHVTLALGLTDHALAEFLRASAEHKLDETFLVKRIWLAEQAPSGPWQYLASYPLGIPSEEEFSYHGVAL